MPYKKRVAVIATRGAAPPHVEAYPKLDLLAATKASAAKRPVCAFFDEEGFRRGGIVIRHVGEEKLKIFCSIDWGDEIGFLYRDMTFDIFRGLQSVGKLRWYVKCPLCRNRKQNLYFHHRWACRSCLKLTYRSQVVDPTFRLVEERDDLWARIGKGRPCGMHTRTYQAKLQRLGELKRTLRKTRVRVPNVVHQRLCRTEWRTLSEDHAWLSRDGPWFMKNGELVQESWGTERG